MWNQDENENITSLFIINGYCFPDSSAKAIRSQAAAIIAYISILFHKYIYVYKVDRYEFRVPKNAYTHLP